MIECWRKEVDLTSVKRVGATEAGVVGFRAGKKMRLFCAFESRGVGGQPLRRVLATLGRDVRRMSAA